jgi:hypothetical protein
MGLLGTRWEAEYEGHAIVVSRNELTRGFSLEWDGAEIAKRVWSLVGLGELHGSAEVGGKPGYRDGQARSVDVKVSIQWGGLKELDGHCTITVDGHEVPVKHVR